MSNMINMLILLPVCKSSHTQGSHSTTVAERQRYYPVTELNQPHVLLFTSELPPATMSSS